MEKVLSDHLNEIQNFFVAALSLLLFGMRVESSAQQVCSVESKEVMKMLTVDVFNCKLIVCVYINFIRNERMHPL